MNPPLRSPEQTICEVIDSYAVADPHRTVLIDSADKTVSYSELSKMLATLGETFRIEQLGPKDVVAIMLEDDIYGVAALLATMQCCTCSPLNPASTEAELRTDLKNLGAAAVVVSATAKMAKAVAEDLGLLWIEAGSGSKDCPWRSGGRPFAGSGSAKQPETPDNRLLLHTSATTGRRKIVALSSFSFGCMLANTQRALSLNENDRLLMIARTFHTQGILSLAVQIAAGGSVILMGGFTSQTFRRCLDTLQPTWYSCAPTVHRAILAHLRHLPLTGLTSLRFIRSGGAMLPPLLRLELERTLQVPVSVVYGLTEVGAVACTNPELTRRLLPEQFTAVGVSMGPTIGVISPLGDLLEPGQEGEIVVGGPTVMSGYLHDTEANRLAFHAGWFRTGDLGHLDADGLLYVTGRLKEIINRGGQKIVPDEVDAVLEMHPSVHAAAAFAVAHPTLGEDISCAVVLRKGAAATESELRSFARQQLAAFKVPRHIHFVEEIPCGTTGKPQRLLLTEKLSATVSSLDQPAQTDRLATSEGSGPTVESGLRDLQREVSAIWSRHLNLDEAKPGEDFFTAGGDSLGAVAMLLEVEEVLGLQSPIPPPRFFEKATLRALICLAQGGALNHTGPTLPSGALELVLVKGEKEAFPLFMFPADGDEGSYFRRLARRLGREWSLTLVRPRNGWHDHSMSAIEDAAAQAATLIRSIRPRGPLAIGGFCYGGVVAFETARLLEQTGDKVLLVLFDTPMPGSPHVIRDLGTYAKIMVDRTLLACKTRSLKPVTGLCWLLGLRLLWHTLRRTRPRRLPIDLLWEKIRRAYFPLYRAAPIHSPVHHFVVRNDDVVRATAREAWSKLCLSGMKTTYLLGDHHSLLSEEQLPGLVASMTAWIQLNAIP